MDQSVFSEEDLKLAKEMLNTPFLRSPVGQLVAKLADEDDPQGSVVMSDDKGMWAIMPRDVYDDILVHQRGWQQAKPKLDRLLALLQEGKDIVQNLEEVDAVVAIFKEFLPEVEKYEKLLILAGAGTDDGPRPILGLIPQGEGLHEEVP